MNRIGFTFDHFKDLGRTGIDAFFVAGAFVFINYYFKHGFLLSLKIVTDFFRRFSIEP